MPATFTNKAISGITTTTAIGGAVYTTTGDTIVFTSYGIAWSTGATPTVSDGHTNNGSATGTTINWTNSLTGLTPNKTYNVIPYFIFSGNSGNPVYPSYSDKKVFTTLANPPTVLTIGASAIAQTTATGGGNVTAGDLVTARGVAWSTSSGATTGATHTTHDGTGTGMFTSLLTGLTSNTKYYVRAYAVNNGGITYGTELNFTTLALPTVTTTTVSTIGQTTATGGGNVTASGGTTITARGVCWSTGATPTINNSKTTNGTGSGVFISSLTGLTVDKKYYYCAYATNSVGTAYGTILNFTTLPLLATVITTPITMITEINANGGGNVTAGASIVHRGIVWGTSPNPTITGNSKTIQTGTTGIFISTLTGLTKNATYYARAYVTNTDGTSYGTQISFVAMTTEVSTVGYDLYLKTGIGDKSIFDAEFAAIDRTIFVDVTYTPEEIVAGNIK